MNRLLQSTVILAFVSLSGRRLRSLFTARSTRIRTAHVARGTRDYLRTKGIEIDIKPVADIAAISKGAGIPADYQGCHTLILERLRD